MPTFREIVQTRGGNRSPDLYMLDGIECRFLCRLRASPRTVSHQNVNRKGIHGLSTLQSFCQISYKMTSCPTSVMSLMDSQDDCRQRRRMGGRLFRERHACRRGCEHCHRRPTDRLKRRRRWRRQATLFPAHANGLFGAAAAVATRADRRSDMLTS